MITYNWDLATGSWYPAPNTNTIADKNIPLSAGREIPLGWWGQKQKQEEQQMFDECTPCAQPKIKRAFISAPVANAQVISNVPVEATQRDHAIARVKQIGEKHDAALRVQFNINHKIPHTFLELEALIKSGDYTVSDAAKSDDAKFWNVLWGVTFGKPADKDGYEAARDTLKEALQTAVDNVTLADIDTLLTEIEDFKAWTLPAD